MSLLPTKTSQSCPGGGRLVPVLVVIVLLGIVPAQALGTEDDDLQPLLWRVPESGNLVLAPLTGWSLGEQLDGLLVGMRAMFMFDYFIGGINGQSIFVDSGVVYLAGLDLHGRYGPFYGGFGFTGHFFPGSTSSTTPSLNLQAGVHFPTFFSFAFLEIAYRINVVFHAGRQQVYHTFLLGLLFESGT